MKYINNSFTRIYIIQILNVYFAKMTYRNQLINFDKLNNINIDEIFTEIFLFPVAELNMELIKKILKYYQEKEVYINTLREKYQDRNSKTVDFFLILILNVAICEHLSQKISIQILISEYVNICSIFHNATQFIHSILDKVLNSLVQEKTLLN
jgi:transcription termination factor NusB